MQSKCDADTLLLSCCFGIQTLVAERSFARNRNQIQAISVTKQTATSCDWAQVNKWISTKNRELKINESEFSAWKTFFYGYYYFIFKQLDGVSIWIANQVENIYWEKRDCWVESVSSPIFCCCRLHELKWQSRWMKLYVSYFNCSRVFFSGAVNGASQMGAQVNDVSGFSTVSK